MSALTRLWRGPGLIRTVALLAVLAALTSFVVRCAIDPGALPHASPPSGTLATPPPSAVAADPGGGAITIVESGYRRLTDLAGDPMLSVGAVVANTSTSMTGAAEIEVSLVDDDGKPVEDPERRSLTITVPPLLPGQRSGLGSTAYTARTGEYSSVQLTIGRTRWWPPDAAPPELGAITVSDVTVSWQGKGERESYWNDSGISAPVNKRGRMNLAFHVESAQPDIVNTAISVVYRDTEGHIVGGYGTDDGHEFYGLIPPGRSERSLEIRYGPPAGTADTAPEVYLLPAIGLPL